MEECDCTCVDVLRMEGLGLVFPGRVPVFRDVHLRVPKGQLVSLEGASGSGKSSLLAIAAGLLPPSRGNLSVLGGPAPTTESDWARLRGRGIGLVFQHLNLIGELSVAENVELPLVLARVHRSQRRQRVADLLQRFQIEDLAGKRPGILSGGEQQRVAIARALAKQPALLLVDEPTSALDRDNAATVVSALWEAARSGAGVLVASHDDALRQAPLRYRIQDGRVIQA